MTRIFHWFFYVKDGSHVRLRHPSCVYISAQRQYTAVLKMCTLLKWLSLPYILDMYHVLGFGLIFWSIKNLVKQYLNRYKTFSYTCLGPVEGGGISRGYNKVAPPCTPANQIGKTKFQSSMHHHKTLAKRENITFIIIFTTNSVLKRENITFIIIFTTDSVLKRERILHLLLYSQQILF